MYAEVICPTCERKQRVFAVALGRPVRCLGCNARFVAPAAESAPAGPAQGTAGPPVTARPEPAAEIHEEPAEVLPPDNPETVGLEVVDAVVVDASADKPRLARSTPKDDRPVPFHRTARPPSHPSALWLLIPCLLI